MPKVEVENAYVPPWRDYKMFNRIANNGNKYITGYNIETGKQLRRYEYQKAILNDDEIPNSIEDIEKITSYKDNPKLWMKLYMRGSRRGGLGKNKGTKTNQKKRYPDSNSGKEKKRVVKEKEIKQSKKAEEEKRDEDKEKHKEQKVMNKVIDKVLDKKEGPFERDPEKLDKMESGKLNDRQKAILDKYHKKLEDKKEDEKEDKKEESELEKLEKIKMRNLDPLRKRKLLRLRKEAEDKKEEDKQKEEEDKQKARGEDSKEDDPEKLKDMKFSDLTPEQKKILKSSRAKEGVVKRAETKRLTEEAQNKPEYKKWELETNVKVEKAVRDYNKSISLQEDLLNDINRQKKVVIENDKDFVSGDYREKSSYYKDLKKDKDKVDKDEEDLKKATERRKNYYKEQIESNKKFINDPYNKKRIIKEIEEDGKEQRWIGMGKNTYQFYMINAEERLKRNEKRLKALEEMDAKTFHKFMIKDLDHQERSPLEEQAFDSDFEERDRRMNTSPFSAERQLKRSKEDLEKTEKRIKDKDWRQNKKEAQKKKDGYKNYYNKLVDDYNKKLTSFRSATEEMKKMEDFVFGTENPNNHSGKVDNKVSKQNPFAYKKEKITPYDKKRKPLFKIKYKELKPLTKYKYKS